MSSTGKFRPAGETITVYEVRDVLDKVIYIGCTDFYDQVKKVYRGLLVATVVKEFKNLKDGFKLQGELNKKYGFGWEGWPNWDKSPSIDIIW